MILSGKEVAEDILKKAEENIKKLNLKPTLGIISVGNDPASEIYVKKKLTISEKIGIEAKHYRLAANASEKELLILIEKLNNDKKTTGFIVQLPLPKHMNENKVIEAIAPEKDVDGFHPINIGKLFLGLEDPSAMIPATPYGVMKMLEYYEVELEGKHAVVVGRGNNVGKPIAILLLNRNATVSICHSKTQNLREYTKQADILVVAVGKPKLITEDMVKEGAYVIDIGINRVGDKIIGDVDFEKVSKKAHCSPVPGGVGLLTVAMLMHNTVKAAANRK